MYSITINFDDKGKCSLNLDGDPPLLEAAAWCLDSAISILKENGDTAESARKRIILSLVESLENDKA